jgi:hypothetical protein
MKGATSINIQPIKGGSEDHNLRTKELHYVRKDLSDKNESFSIDAVKDRLATIKRTYRETTGQKMQKTATPIREGVVVIDKNTSMQQLKSFADRCEKRFGIKAFQIHIHRDEGHRKSKEEWKENLHAHIVYDWTDSKGKSIKLNRYDMIEMQTMLADSLNMKRGVSSDKEHLSAIQFKNLAEQEKAKKLHQEINEPISSEITAKIEKKLLGRGEVAKVDKNDLKELVLAKKHYQERAEKAEYENKQKEQVIEGYRTMKAKQSQDVEYLARQKAVDLVNQILQQIGVNKRLTHDFKLRDVAPKQQNKGKDFGQTI